MSSERHAYGTSCGCLGRRLFVLASCFVLMALCYLQLFRWTVKSHLMDPRGLQEVAREPQDCTGTECLEVFSCYGMRETTFHLREPFITVAGAVALPLGVFGAHQGSPWHLQMAVRYLIVNTLLRTGIIVGDAAYFGVCDAYSYNVVDQILLQTKGLVRRGVQDKLEKLSNFPVERIDAITGGFRTLAFYIAFACAWVLFVAYLAREGYKLGQLLETGPLGLGVHYGLDQWDEEFRYNDVKEARRLKESLMESNFINDATIPERRPLDLYPGFAVSPATGRHAGYGSAPLFGNGGPVAWEAGDH